MSLLTKKTLVIIVLIGIGYLLHRPFFDLDTLLFFSDRTNRSDNAVKDLFFKGIMTRQSQHWFGEEYAQASFFWFKLFWWLLGSYTLATKATFFIPLALLSFISPFVLSCYLTKNNLPIAFVTSLFYGTITYLSVKTTSHLPIAMVFVLSPLIITFFLKYLSNQRHRDLLLFNLFFFIGIVYEIRIMLIVSGILFVTFLVFSEKKFRKKLLPWIGITFILQLLLNAYWILPVFHMSWESISQTTQRWLFWDSLFSLSHALTLFESSWTGWIPNQNFIPQPIPWYMRFYPAIVVWWLFSLKRINKKQFFWWASLFFVGVLLTKQSAWPIGGLYQFLYENIPGFNLFREASKFYQITAIGYLIVLSIVWNGWWKKHIRATSWVLLCSIIISTVLAYPLLTGWIWLIRTPKTMPETYVIYNKLLTDSQSSYKTLWIPMHSQWSEYSIQHPRIAFSTVNRATRKSIYTWNSETVSLKIAQLNDMVIDRGNIKYVVIPWKDVRKEMYGTSYEEVREAIEKVSFLQRLDLKHPEQIDVYINTGAYGEVFFPHLSWLYTSCTRDKIKSSEVIFSCWLSSDSVILSQQYNTERRVYKNTPHRRHILTWRAKPETLPQKEFDGLMKFSFPVESQQKYTFYFLPEARFMLWIYISCLWIILFCCLSIMTFQKK